MDLSPPFARRLSSVVSGVTRAAADRQHRGHVASTGTQFEFGPHPTLWARAPVQSAIARTSLDLQVERALA